MSREPAAWVAIVAVGLRLSRRARAPWWIGPLLLALSGLALVGEPLYRSLYQASWLLMCALAVGPPEDMPRKSRAAVLWILSVGAMAGLVIGYSSTNAFRAVGVGALVAAGPAIAVLVARARIGVSSRVTPSLRSGVALGAAAVVAVLSMAAGIQVAYRDGPPLTLTARVPEGPFAGVRTTSERAAYLAGASRLIAPRAPAGTSLATYGRIPVVYLLGEADPVAPQVGIPMAVWTAPSSSSTMVRYYALAGHTPDVVVVDRAEQPAMEVTVGEMRRVFAARFTRVASWESLDVWVRE
jgi:hypothetical protein